MSEKYDVIIIGAGIGGLTAGAILSRNGKKVLVLEKNPVPGGYAVNFKRKGFTFEASLHLINGGSCGAAQYILKKCGIDSKIEFLKPRFLYRSIFPDFDIQIPQCNLSEFIEILSNKFPREKQNIYKLVKSIKDLALEVQQLRESIISENESTYLPLEYKASSYYLHKSWGEITDIFLDSKELKGIFSQLWPFFGVPPKTLSAYYFAASLFDYIINGGYYLSRGSGSLSLALSDIIKTNSGKILFNAKVDKILLHNKQATGVKITSGEHFSGDTVISNIDLINTFSNLLSQEDVPMKFLKDIKEMKHSISAFEVHLGLNIDLNKRDDFDSDFEVFLNPSYDFDGQYSAALKNDMNNAPLALTFYSNIDKNLAPPQKSYISITALAGYDFWANCSEKEYKVNKENLADILIKRVESVVPGLSNLIELRDIATPLTMARYTGNYKGSVFGWEQNVAQSGINRTNNFTPINKFYLVGAWTRPGAGIIGVMQSGERVAEQIMSRKNNKI